MGWETVSTILGAPLGFACFLYFVWTQRSRKNIVGKTVLITGASSGLGEACAKEFHKAGCRVVLVGRNQTQLDRVKGELLQLKKPTDDLEPEIFLMDLGNLSSLPDLVDNLVRQVGPIHILVNNAGVSSRGQVEDTTVDAFIKVMTINLFGQVALTKALLPYMISEGEGSIVGISSIQGKIAIPYRASYAASKHAFHAFHDSLKAEVAHRNIDVCVVCPSYIQTNLSKNAVTGDGSAYGVEEKEIATGMKPEYVARQILFSVIERRDEVVLGPLHHRLAIVLRTLSPYIYFLIMKHRANSSRKQYVKIN
ncbi:dehydrogenase/reductase SDR family protein 7-like [Pecten maximus]|uniref:dehydrogenase/reductase SDR family protein 7-like n=1 Tax=Pecten maximus TaxID=6579 RepID=UPI00145813B3|nr:dehydrogenase/reductase SDR family protein 7-like [Pecten maximus]XP_033737577.1 dehydrogenase/reductase SDR family protein 7-like [Pecten maximus]